MFDPLIGKIVFIAVCIKGPLETKEVQLTQLHPLKDTFYFISYI